MTSIAEKEFKKKTVEANPSFWMRIQNGYCGFIKRAFDITVSLLGLVFLAPYFGLIAIGIKHDSDGPVYYKGDRVGRGGKRFKMLKFRTMYETPASYAGSPITSNGDGRITPFGQWLRDTKVNELPQLWNVLHGEMSFVGPRPEDPDFVAKWPEDCREKVLSMRPGITSPASILYRDEEKQLNGDHFLNDYLKEILPDKLRLDQLYVDNHSMLKDLDVIFMTLLSILPLIRKTKIKERTIFSGPVYRLFSKHLSWFLIDFLVAFSAVGVAGVLWRLSYPLNLGFQASILTALSIAVVLSLVSTALGLQHVIWRHASPTLVIDIGLSVASAALIVLAGDYFIDLSFKLPPIFIFSFSLLTFMGMVAARYRERVLTGMANRWTNARSGKKEFGERVLVVGAGDGGELAVWLIHKSGYASAFSIIGFADDDFNKQKYKVADLPVLGTTRDIPELVESHDVGLILFAISKISEAHRVRIMGICEDTDARVIAVPDMISVLNDGC